MIIPHGLRSAGALVGCSDYSSFLKEVGSDRLGLQSTRHCMAFVKTCRSGCLGLGLTEIQALHIDSLIAVRGNCTLKS